MTTNDWNEYKLLVVQGLQESKEQHAVMLAKLTQIEKDITVLQVKAGIWGTIAGTLGAFIAMIIKKGN